MKKKGVLLDLVEVEALRKQIEDWRTTRRRKGPMPPELWDGAAKLAIRHGIFRTCRALGVHYDGLKRQVERRGLERPSTPKERPIVNPSMEAGFVELSSPGLMGAASGAVIEMEHVDGSRLRVELPPHMGLDVLKLSERFWGRV